MSSVAENGMVHVGPSKCEEISEIANLQKTVAMVKQQAHFD
jgi:hypothetical protein